MGSIRALIALFRYRSIRALIALFRYRSIRALVALFRYRSIRALCRPISLSLNTGSGSGYVLVSLRAYAYAFLPGVALRYTLGCILAPLQGALDPNRALRAPAKYVGTFPGR